MAIFGADIILGAAQVIETVWLFIAEVTETVDIRPIGGITFRFFITDEVERHEERIRPEGRGGNVLLAELSWTGVADIGSVSDVGAGADL